jgi:hypothetical protein
MSAGEAKVGKPRLALGVKHTVIAGLADFGAGIVLLSEHREASREIGHQEARSKIVIRRQCAG